MYTKVVGVTYPNDDGSSRQKILKKMRREEREYERVTLEHEPNNPYDSNAIKVLNNDGEQLGYLESRLAEDILKRVAKGEIFSAVITEFTGGEGDKPTVGCNLEIKSTYVRGKTESGDGELRLTFAFYGVLILIIAVIAFIGGKPQKNGIPVITQTGEYLGPNTGVTIDPVLAKSLDKQAQERREAQKKADAQELYELRKKLTSKVDEVSGSKWIYDKTTKRQIDRRTSRKNFFYVYLGQSGSHMWPRLRMGFIKDDWIFFYRVVINIDGDVRRLSFRHFDVNRDVLGGGTITEYVDVLADGDGALIKAMAKGKKVIVRFEGSQYHYDFTMTKEQKNALWNIWRVYELMR